MNPNILPLCPVCGLPLERQTFEPFRGDDKIVPAPIYYCVNAGCPEGKAQIAITGWLAWKDRVTAENKAIEKHRKEENQRRAAALHRLIAEWWGESK